MFKKLCLIILILIPFTVNATSYDANVQGSSYQSPDAAGDGNVTCKDLQYKIQSFGNTYYLQGIRVTFYSDSGEKVGRTVDVWTYGKNAAGNFPMGKDNYVGDNFYYYENSIGHTKNYYSKVDYSKGAKFEYDPETSYKTPYKFYVDNKALKETKYVGYTSKILSGPLFYSLQSSDKTLLRNYFLDEENMKRYMRLAQADTLLDIEVGDYQMVIEPVLRINNCGYIKRNNKYVSYKGAYTSTEIGLLYEQEGETCEKYLKAMGYKNPSMFKDATKKIPGWLALGSDAPVAGVFYQSTWVVNTSGKGRTFTYEEMRSKTLGVGIAVINGKDVCGEKCKEPNARYKIVYRTIDLNNPFLGLDGKKRTLSEKSNWYGKEEMIDANVYNNAPKYVIILSPATINKIRESNRNIKYNEIFLKYNSDSTFADSEFKKNFGL